ncbi:hypothetical protein [Pseudomonas amygdali]|uniref:hypothetical protein n=1 Tax=Pseudomonas amygdali TaxID=47877 RepID=UPI00107335A6|nr:hypothetical protein [Pseudomonas amygdali]
MAKRRGRNINDPAIIQIVKLLDGWTAKLSWDLLVDEIEVRMGIRYTRQALDKHARIKIAYQATKKRVSNPSGQGLRQKYCSQELGPTLERLERLGAENSRIKMENQRLLEQFVTWAYNAHLKGLTQEYLNTPLPGVDREVTKSASDNKSTGGRGRLPLLPTRGR